MSRKGIDEFLKYKKSLEQPKKKEEDLYEQDFKKLRDASERLKHDPFYSTSEGENACNLEKNRYKDILPFDYNRVKLRETSEADNDYINASFIKGIGNESYIAAQGPLPKTVNDFWSVIWDYNVKFVVMACQEYEGYPTKLKCFRYWNQDTTEELTFGKITVKMTEEESFLPGTNEAVVKRTLRVQKNQSETRTVIHIHHTKWPDKFVPARVDSILALLSQTRVGRNKPVLMHCSAGCGRTGTLIVIDYVWSMLKKEGIQEKFNLFEILLAMRKQRTSFVQSTDQYHFVYEAIAKLFQGESGPGPKPAVPIRKMNSNPKSPQNGTSTTEKLDVYVNDPGSRSNPSFVSPPPSNLPGSNFNKNGNKFKNPNPYYPNPEAERSENKVKNSNPYYPNPEIERSEIKKTGYVYLGYDIGFPNRIPVRFVGPRPMKI